MTAYRLQFATATHKGDREYQQDRVRVIAHPYNKRCVMVALADGMGGRSGGAMAADQALLSAEQMWQQFDPGSGADPKDALRQVAADAHGVIRMLNISTEHEPHTTIAVFITTPNGACHWLHSGDSRIYHFRSGKMRFRTRDHSYVQSLIDRGELTEEEAVGHPDSNMLVGCLGSTTIPPVGEHTIERLVPGDAVLSCTDGLWAYFSEAELAKMVQSTPPRRACERLIEQARQRAQGGGDNLTVALMCVQDISPEERAALAAQSGKEQGSSKPTFNW